MSLVGIYLVLTFSEWGKNRLANWCEISI